MQVDPTVASILLGVVAMLVGLYNLRRQMVRDNREMVAEMIKPLAEQLEKTAAKASGAWDKVIVLEARHDAEHHR